VAEFGESLDIFDKDGFFDEHEMVGFKFLHQHPCHRLMDASMEIDCDAEVFSAGFADGGDPLNSGGDFAPGVDIIHFGSTVHLDGIVALFGFFGRSGGGIIGTVAADPAVDLNFVADRTAEEFIHGDIESFAFDIPESLFDTGDGTGKNRAAAIESAAIEGLDDIFDLERVASDEIGSKFIDGGFDSIGSAFDNRFTPSADAFIGHRFEEKPAGGNLKEFKRSDFHNK